LGREEAVVVGNGILQQEGQDFESASVRAHAGAQ
jgi:hypothetical protein